jgi:hypothetical protein
VAIPHEISKRHVVMPQENGENGEDVNGRVGWLWWVPTHSAIGIEKQVLRLRSAALRRMGHGDSWAETQNPGLKAGVVGLRFRGLKAPAPSAEDSSRFPPLE